MTTSPNFAEQNGAAVVITGGGSGIGAVLTEALLDWALAINFKSDIFAIQAVGPVIDGRVMVTG
jgi:hypothetical protein